jgi:hypothetical protein
MKPTRRTKDGWRAARKKGARRMDAISHQYGGPHKKGIDEYGIAYAHRRVRKGRRAS